MVQRSYMEDDLVTLLTLTKPLSFYTHTHTKYPTGYHMHVRSLNQSVSFSDSLSLSRTLGKDSVLATKGLQEAGGDQGAAIQFQCGIAKVLRCFKADS